jgi:hypothetical protein
LSSQATAEVSKKSAADTPGQRFLRDQHANDNSELSQWDTKAATFPEQMAGDDDADEGNALGSCAIYRDDSLTATASTSAAPVATSW